MNGDEIQIGGACLVYVSDDGYYMRDKEVIEQVGGFPDEVFQNLIPPTQEWTDEEAMSEEVIKTRAFKAVRIPTLGPVPAGPEGDAIVSELIGREVRHWKR